MRIQKFTKGEWIGIVGIVVSVILAIFVTSPVLSQKVTNSPYSINTVGQTGGVNTLVVPASQITETQEQMILKTLGSSSYSVHIGHTSGASNVIAKRLADIFAKAGWHVDYNPSALVVGQLVPGKIEIGVSDNHPTVEAMTIYSALSAANLPFPVSYIVGRSGDVMVGDF